MTDSLVQGYAYLYVCVGGRENERNEEKIENIYVIATPTACRFSTLNQSKAQIERMNYISVSDFLTIFFRCFGFWASKTASPPISIANGFGL